MKSFLIWALKALVFITIIAIITLISEGGFDGVELSFLIPWILGSSIFLGFIFWVTEKKYIPYKRKKLNEKIAKIFEGKIVSENSCTFKLGELDVITEVEFSLNIYESSGAMGFIYFHTARSQVDKIQNKYQLKLREDFLEGLPTYNFYQTNGWGLKLAKRRLEKKLLKSYKQP